MRKLTDKQIAEIVKLAFSDSDGFLSQAYFEKCLDSLFYGVVRDEIDNQVQFLSEQEKYDSVVKMVKKS